jgi:hypothetical protein
MKFYIVRGVRSHCWCMYSHFVLTCRILFPANPTGACAAVQVLHVVGSVGLVSVVWGAGRGVAFDGNGGGDGVSQGASERR